MKLKTQKHTHRSDEGFAQILVILTLGPQGPLLHKGVLVVLQSEHTLTTPIACCCCCWPSSCCACALLLGFLAAPPTGYSLVAFLMIFIFAAAGGAATAQPSARCLFSILYGSYAAADRWIMSPSMLGIVGRNSAGLGKMSDPLSTMRSVNYKRERRKTY